MTFAVLDKADRTRIIRNDTYRQVYQILPNGREKVRPPPLSAITYSDSTRRQECSRKEHVGYPPIYETRTATICDAN